MLYVSGLLCASQKDVWLLIDEEDDQASPSLDVMRSERVRESVERPQVDSQWEDQPQSQQE